MQPQNRLNKRREEEKEKDKSSPSHEQKKSTEFVTDSAGDPSYLRVEVCATDVDERTSAGYSFRTPATATNSFQTEATATDALV